MKLDKVSAAGQGPVVRVHVRCWAEEEQDGGASWKEVVLRTWYGVAAVPTVSVFPTASRGRAPATHI